MDKEMKRRCTRTNMDMLHSLVVLCLIYSACCTGLVNGLTIALNKNAVRTSDLKIFISTSSITSLIILTKPDASSDNCAAPILGPGLCSTPDLSQDFTTNVTTYSISSLVRSRDEGIWTAVHGVSDTNTIDIKVLTIPTLNVAQTVSALTLSSSNTQTLTITATCAYPAVSLVLYFVPTGGGTAVLSTSSTSSCTNSGSACADTDAQNYACDIVPKLEASLSVGTYNMLVVVNLVGQYEPIGLNATITDTVITVTGPTTTTIPTTTTTTTPTTTTTTPTTTTTTPTTTTTTPTTTTTTPTTTTTTPTMITTTPTTTTRSTTTTKRSNATSARFTDEELGAIIGGTVGGVCLLIIIIGLAVFHYYRVQKKGSVKTDDKRGNLTDGRDRRDKPRRGDKPSRGDNRWAPMEKETVVEYHNGQAYLVDPRHYKDPRSHGYHNMGYDPEHHRREMRPHHNMGRTKSNGHFISSRSYYTGQRSHSSQGYPGERSSGHYSSAKIYRGQSSVLQVYQPEDFPQFYTDQHFRGGQDGYGRHSHATGVDPRPGREDNHTLMYY